MMSDLKNFNTKFFIDVDKDCRWEIASRDIFLEFVKQFPNQRLLMELSVYQGKRTDSQGGYYFGVVIPSQILAHKEFHGIVFSKNQMHEFNKANFFATEIYSPVSNEVIKIPTSSTIYNVNQFGNILERVVSFYYENFDWVIPPPTDN